MGADQHEPSYATPIWQRSDAVFLFHHTSSENALAIAESGRFRVGSGSLLGLHGIYVTDEDPVGLSLEQISERYFFKRWPVEALGGVAVFVNDPQRPFVHQADSIWVLGEGAEGTWLEVSDLVVGWGMFLPDGTWSWSPGLLL